MNVSRLSLAVLFVCSFSVQAKVSIEEKENRVQFIEKIGAAAPSLSVEAYRRELDYERQGLPLEVRAGREARLIAERIQAQITLAYEMAMSQHGDSTRAVAEVREVISKDLELAAPEFKTELQTLAENTLRQIELGGVSNAATLSSLEQVILPNVQARAEYLNEEVMDATVPPGSIQADFVPDSDAGNDSERLEYRDEQDLAESLVSDRASTRWVSTANKTINSGVTVTRETNISYQVKIKFMGVSIEAGPTVTFRRDYASFATLMAEELNPIVLNDGNFDFYKRNRRGAIILRNGVPQRRFIAFFCSLELRFSTDYRGSGGFYFAGAGSSTSVSQNYANSITQNSRRILVPNYVGGRTLTLERIANICHRDFLNAKLNHNLTVEQSLNIEMRNMVSSLTFSHDRTRCVIDSQCINWFNTEVMAIWQYGTFPRCVEESQRELNRACVVRGLENMACKIYRNGRVISSGQWEVDCDQGLRCIQTRLQFRSMRAEGKCMPINRRTYRSPKENDQVRFINVRIAPTN